MRKWELKMKRHPPINYSFSQTGAWCSCDSMIRPPTQHTHALHTSAHIQASHVHFFLCIARLSFRHIYRLLGYIYHYTRRTFTWRCPPPPLAADQSMSSFSQWGRMIHAGTWGARIVSASLMLIEQFFLKVDLY